MSIDKTTILSSVAKIDKEEGVLKIGFCNTGMVRRVCWVADLPIVRHVAHGPVVLTCGGEVFIPEFRIKDIGVLGRVNDVKYTLIEFFRDQVRRSGQMVVPCTPAGKGPTEKSRKVKVNVMREYEAMGPDDVTKETVSRVFTVPKSQVKKVNGSLFVSEWVVRKKLDGPEELIDKKWEGESALVKQVEGWVSQFLKKEEKEKKQKEDKKKKRDAEKARREEEAAKSINELCSGSIKSVALEVMKLENAVRALSIVEQLGELDDKYHELMLSMLDDKPVGQALAIVNEAVRNDKKADEIRKRVKRFAEMEKMLGVSVRFHEWEKKKGRFVKTQIILDKCDIYFSGARAYLVVDDDFDDVIIKKRDSLEILSRSA